jgi:hypothetical protein
MPLTPTRHTPEWVAPLLEALTAQHDIIERLRPMAQQQGALIESGRTDALLALLAERQQLLDELLRAQERIGRLSTERREHLRGLEAPARDELRSLMEAIDGGLAAVLEIDARDQKKLEEARHETKRRLASVDTVRTARTAYVKPAGGGPRFTDRRG